MRTKTSRFPATCTATVLAAIIATAAIGASGSAFAACGVSSGAHMNVKPASNGMAGVNTGATASTHGTPASACPSMSRTAATITANSATLGAGVSVRLRLGDVRLLAQAVTLSGAGFVTGASNRNWASYGEAVSLPTELEDWRRNLLTDPQTSGGLLVACGAQEASAILARIQEGDPRAAIVGSVAVGDPIVIVEP